MPVFTEEQWKHWKEYIDRGSPKVGWYYLYCLAELNGDDKLTVTIQEDAKQSTYLKFAKRVHTLPDSLLKRLYDSAKRDEPLDATYWADKLNRYLPARSLYMQNPTTWELVLKSGSYLHYLQLVNFTQSDNVKDAALLIRRTEPTLTELKVNTVIRINEHIVEEIQEGNVSQRESIYWVSILLRVITAPTVDKLRMVLQHEQALDLLETAPAPQSSNGA